MERFTLRSFEQTHIVEKPGPRLSGEFLSKHDNLLLQQTRALIAQREAQEMQEAEEVESLPDESLIHQSVISLPGYLNRMDDL
ncbi:hypothetical protein HY469_03730 [Candidatus Roizmanbacteria bacterium]|nr:hypothetical protein [Candidatus Roizmanbacteria bacterium]